LEKEDVSSTFESVGAYIDLNARRMAEFPAEIAASIDEQIEQHATLSWPAPLSGIMQP
jgi:hypothetical protein